MSSSRWRLHFRNRAVRRVRPRVLAALAFGLALCSAGAFAQTAPRPEQVIKWRQSAYQVIAWNTARLRSALGKTGTFDAATVREAADALAAVAAAGLPELFPAATRSGRGWRETTARASVFDDAAGFRALSDDFARESRALAQSAAGADQAAVRERFKKIAQLCKGCHDIYRQMD